MTDRENGATGRAPAATEAFRAARDFLLRHREDYDAARAAFRWPRPEHFNWALDWFDAIADGNDRTALHIVEEDGSETRLSFDEMRRRSDQAANWLRANGRTGRRPDRHDARQPGGAVGDRAGRDEAARRRHPGDPAARPRRPADRIDRGRARHVIVRAADTAKFAEVPGDYTRIAVGGARGRAGWRTRTPTSASDELRARTGPPGPTTR